jgi:hypothetical protein
MFGFSSAITPENPNIYDELSSLADVECDMRGYFWSNILAWPGHRDTGYEAAWSIR